MLRALLLGAVDGLREPWDLGSGLTFGDGRDELYDRGVNAGQRVGRLVEAVREFRRALITALVGPLDP